MPLNGQNAVWTSPTKLGVGILFSGLPAKERISERQKIRPGAVGRIVDAINTMLDYDPPHPRVG